MGKTVSLAIDDQEITAVEGSKLLWAALENGIYIPHLCAVKEENRPSASCRLCFVEIEGKTQPVTACTEPVVEGMAVRTRSARVDRLVKSGFELLISAHRLKCSECPAKGSCQLRRIAGERGLKLKLSRLKPLEKDLFIDDSPTTYTFDRSRCVLCGKCVWEDREEAGVGAIGFSCRGIDRKVTTFRDVPLADSPCIECGLCVEACPVGALFFK